ncbi:MAG: methyl-accepting chemotaxis protein [Sphingomonadaceae bacterium]
MNWFRNLKIASKLMATVAVILSLTMGLGVFALFQLYELEQVTAQITQRWSPGVRLALDVKYDLTRFRNHELFHVLSADPADMRKYETEMATRIKELDASLASYQRLPRAQDELALVQQLQASLLAYRGSVRQVIALSRSGDKAAALEVVRGSSRRDDFAALALVQQLVTLNEEGSARAAQHAGQTYAEACRLVWAVMALAALLGMLLAVWVGRQIARPLQRAVMAARRVAGGDLRAVHCTASRDETGDLLRALHTMVGNLQAMVQQVRVGADTVASASAQIAAGTADLAARSEHQAGALDETAAMAAQLAAGVTRHAADASETHRLMEHTAAAAHAAEQALATMTATMDGIQSASARIGEIVGVMDGLAFQTNLLALNAAVEAARAGPSGAGFAVVAREVRELANRSAASAQQIKALVGGSLTHAERGHQVAQHARATCDQLVAGVRRGAALAAELSNGSRQQHRGLQQVDRTLAALDDVTQQNATLAEQSLTAVMALQEQAQRLARSVALFQLDTEQAPGRRAPARAARASAHEVSDATHAMHAAAAYVAGVV